FDAFGVTSLLFFFFSSRRRHTRFSRDWSSDVCSSDLEADARTTLAGGEVGEVLVLLLLGAVHGDQAAGQGVRSEDAGDAHPAARSEERRVGKECRARRWAGQETEEEADETRK